MKIVRVVVPSHGMAVKVWMNLFEIFDLVYLESRSSRALTVTISNERPTLNFSANLKDGHVLAKFLVATTRYAW